MRIVPVLDLKGGIVVHARRGQRAEYAPLRSPLVAGYAAAPLARDLGVSELLVIDLARVGSGSGPALHAVAELAAALPGVAIYAGGGVRDDDDLRALESAGATGALVATALHDGRVRP